MSSKFQVVILRHIFYKSDLVIIKCKERNGSVDNHLTRGGETFDEPFLIRYEGVCTVTASYCSLNIEIILVVHSDWLHG